MFSGQDLPENGPEGRDNGSGRFSGCAWSVGTSRQMLSAIVLTLGHTGVEKFLRWWYECSFRNYAGEEAISRPRSCRSGAGSRGILEGILNQSSDTRGITIATTSSRGSSVDALSFLSLNFTYRMPRLLPLARKALIIPSIYSLSFCCWSFIDFCYRCCCCYCS
jgi:hypothetical protein